MKKTLCRILLLTIAVLLLLTTAACSRQGKTKVFTVEELSITLTDAFDEKNLLTQTAYYESEDMLVTVLRESDATLRSESLDPEMSAAQYAETVIEMNQINAAVQTDGDLTYFAFRQEISGESCYYVAFIYKTESAFWMIQFVCEAGDAEELQPLIFSYAKNVTFA